MRNTLKYYTIYVCIYNVTLMQFYLDRNKAAAKVWSRKHNKYADYKCIQLIFILYVMIGTLLALYGRSLITLQLIIIFSTDAAQCSFIFRWERFAMSDEKKDLAEKSPFLGADAVKNEAGEKKEKEYLAEQENDEEDIACGFWIFKGPRMQRYFIGYTQLLYFT